MQCCGTLFSVGDDVKWRAVRRLDDNACLDDMLGALAVDVGYLETHHDDRPGELTITGRVHRIRAASLVEALPVT